MYKRQHQQPAPVAGFAVGGHCAAMSQPGQGVDRGANQPVTGPVIHLRDQAETATVLFKFRAVQAPRGRGYEHGGFHFSQAGAGQAGGRC